MASSGTSASATASSSASDKYRLPSQQTIVQMMKLAILEDRPIMMDYWTDSLDRKVVLGVRENNEKMLVKTEDEYTSPVAKIWMINDEYIVMTENSIYVVSKDIPKKRIA